MSDKPINLEPRQDKIVQCPCGCSYTIGNTSHKHDIAVILKPVDEKRIVEAAGKSC